MPTLPEVARAAGVATATAARALGGYGSVSERTRARVIEAADMLGYRTNALARSMITGRTHTFGVVLPDIENSFFAKVFRGIASVARVKGYEGLLIDTDEDSDTERAALKALAERRVDGLIIAPTDRTPSGLFADLLGPDVPIVLLDRELRGLEADAVIVNNAAAAKDATKRLINLGHSRIALLTGADAAMLPGLTSSRSPRGEPVGVSTTYQRTLGYRQALREARVPFRKDLVSAEGFRADQAAAATQRLLSLSDPPTAILALDSLLALGVLTGLHEMGLRCPKDASLVGFDDTDWAPFVTPPLSVVQQPVYELGAEACRLLVSRMQGSSRDRVRRILPTRFIERQSTAPPKKDAALYREK
jgi:LacI family transcriptional regulator